MACKPFTTCFDFIREQRRTVTFTDAKSSTRFVYDNTSLNYLSRYRIDGCLIADAGVKCDYLLLNCDKEVAYFIELKGSDLIRAVEQIDRSIDVLARELGGFTVNARIVLTRTNTIDLRNSKFLKLEKKIQMLGGKLQKQNRQMTEVN